MLTREQIQQNIEAMEAQGAPPDDIQGYLDSLRGQVAPSPQTAPPQPQQQPFSLPGQDTAASVSTGFAKGALTTAKNVLDAAAPITKALNLPGQIAEFVTNGRIKAEAPRVTDTFSEQQLKPEGTAEKVGFYGERIAEFVGASPAIRSGQVALKAALSGPGALSAIGRIAGGAAIEGAGFGAVTLAQTADLKEARNSALFAGGLKAITGGLGEAARAFNLPEKLYQRVFKAAYADMAAELRAAGIDNIKRTNPKLYQDLMNAGIIKLRDGKPIVQETLARQALDRGLSGSLKNMSDTTVEGFLKSELQAQQIANTAKSKVGMNEANFLKLFRTIEQEYAEVGFGEMSQKAKVIADTIVASKGKVDVKTALEARRLLDGLRVQSSYKTVPPKLSLSQENLKQLSDVLRGRLNKTPGMGEVMKNYAFYIDAAEALAREAARMGNNQVISIMDAIFAGGGLAGGNVAPALMASFGRRAMTMPSVITNFAQGIQNSGAMTKGGALLKSAFPLLTRQTE